MVKAVVDPRRIFESVAASKYRGDVILLVPDDHVFTAKELSRFLVCEIDDPDLDLAFEAGRVGNPLEWYENETDESIDDRTRSVKYVDIDAMPTDLIDDIMDEDVVVQPMAWSQIEPYWTERVIE